LLRVRSVVFAAEVGGAAERGDAGGRRGEAARRGVAGGAGRGGEGVRRVLEADGEESGGSGDVLSACDDISELRIRANEGQNVVLASDSATPKPLDALLYSSADALSLRDVRTT
jgi:hypothetical protein